MSKEGIIIDLERIEEIAKLPPPTSKKYMQSFLGKINFVRRFIYDFVETIKPLQDLVKKDILFKWNKQQEFSFTKIKRSIVDAPFLQSP